jgi:predicted esterase
MSGAPSLVDDPRRGQPVYTSGPPPADARLTMILVHGRGGSAHDILALAQEFHTSDVACLAPQAAAHTWYPFSFLEPIQRNEPYLGSALSRLSGLLEGLHKDGIDSARIGLLGFSQGACLAAEYAARNPQRYAAVVALSGGLIGPPGTARDYPGSFDGTPIFFGCSDVDPHIPLDRVRESADVFRRMNGDVDERIYRRMGHTVNSDEIAAVIDLLRAPVSGNG